MIDVSSSPYSVGLKDESSVCYQEDDEEFVDIESNNNHHHEIQSNENVTTENNSNDKLTTINENFPAVTTTATAKVIDNDGEHSGSGEATDQHTSITTTNEQLETRNDTPVHGETLDSGEPGTTSNTTERKLSCVSVEVDEITVVESVEELAAVQEITISECSDIAGGNGDLAITVVDANALSPASAADLNFKLESVTEETEEELKADGSGRSPQVRRNQRLTSDSSLLNASQTQSLTDLLPPIPPKRVGILKRAGAKKDRPLSDSFENLKMVENQGIIDLYALFDCFHYFVPL